MRKIINSHKLFWSQRPLALSALVGVLLLAFSLFINYCANIYVAFSASVAVSDIILDYLPVFNVDFIFIEGFIIFIIFIIFLLIREPQKIPFVLKSIAVFILIRAVFISLTHVALPPEHSFLDLGKILQGFTSGNDLFFSSHAGLPFLMALVFWEYKKIRLIFIFSSLIFAASVLLGHLHYSIDVFAAYFIAYGIFRLAQILFPKDYKLLFNIKNNF
jgi:hypothetical protein